MRLTDKQVLDVIARLDRPTPQQEIAALADCSLTTVKRAVRRLIKHKMLRVSGRGNRVPYTYHICFDELPDDVRTFLHRDNS